MADVVEVTNHAELGLERLSEALKGKPQLEAFLRVYLTQVQELEAALMQLLTARRLATATGATLRLFGRIVGQPYLGESDAVYRQRIRARIRVLRSTGRPEALYSILRSLFDDGTLRYDPEYPAGFLLHIEGRATTTADAALFAGFLSAARAAGVGGQLHYSIDTDELTFTLADGAIIVNTDQGLNDIDDPSPQGGQLADVEVL